MQYNICYSFDSNYVEQFMVSVVSLLANADKDECFDIFVLDGGLTKTDKAVIESLKKSYKNFSLKYLSVNEKDFKNCPLLKEKSQDFKHYHVTLPTYFRFKLPSILGKINSVLYLDCDVIIRGSLKDLFSIDLKNTAAAMVKDVESDSEAKRLSLKNYFNAGVMLINLDYWRKNKIENKLFEYTKTHTDEIKWQDQDILNCVLNENIKAIDTKWNYQYFLYDEVNTNDLNEAEILHLSGRFKPWLLPFEHPIYDIYYSYLYETPFFKKVSEYKLKSIGRFIKNNIGGRETNILLNATNDDVNKVFEAIDKLYQYANNLEQIILQKADEKIKEIYNETQKNYSYIDSVREEVKKEFEFNITQETDKKAKELYKEIKSNYAYIDSVRDEMKKNIEFNISQETDKKAEELYKEIKSNYAYIDSVRDEMKKNIEFNISQETDKKAEELYKEIKRNYAYIDSVRDEMKKDIEFNITQETDKKSEELYDAIEKSYLYVDKVRDEIKKELVFKISKDTDKKIDNLYKEIKKNYAYVDEVRKESEFETEKNTDEKITKLYQEITKNYKYVDKIRDEIKKEIEFNVSKDTDEKIAHIYSEISKNYKYTEQLRDEVKEYADEKENNLYKIIANETDKIPSENTESDSSNAIISTLVEKLSAIQKENKKLKEQMTSMEEELAICQISLSKLLKKSGNENKSLFNERKN